MNQLKFNYPIGLQQLKIISSKLVLQNDQSLNEFYLSGIGASPVSFSIFAYCS
jgi:hypothetical protein